MVLEYASKKAFVYVELGSTSYSSRLFDLTEIIDEKSNFVSNNSL
ncbi:19448_t:CDS:2 [Cetraspora pellucida]|uniref:19448_t:CDS:1 n=1 Tax=Cetraspora pellucida TaxID=1433469 RepID=A0A9N9B6A3_9GLOM|nr:19448_t:CDS:2 [Cetraspora pellucida]